ASSTSRTFFPGARPVRLETRKMWVSTAMVGSPKAVLSTTLAVLRPTPGSASSAARSRGTSPPCCSSRMRQVAITFLALALYRPMVLMYSFSRSSPRSAIACGVLATGNSRRVALFTPTSVAWADRITPISSSNGVAYSSSVVGFGLSSDSRRNISSISSRVIRLPRRRRGAVTAVPLTGRHLQPAGARGPARPRRQAAGRAVCRPGPAPSAPGACRAAPRPCGPAARCGRGGGHAPPRRPAACRAQPASAPAALARARGTPAGRTRPARRRWRRPGRPRPAVRAAAARARLRSLAGELGLALFQERAGALAHVGRGKDQPELGALVFQGFADAALRAGVHAIQDSAQRERGRSGQAVGKLHRAFLQLVRGEHLVDDPQLVRAGGVHRRAAQAQFQGGGAAGQAEQALGAAKARQQAQVDFGLAHPGGV